MCAHNYLLALALIAPTAATPALAASNVSASDSSQRATTPHSQLPQKAEPAVSARVIGFYGNLPLRFEANRGQTDRRVTFLARGREYVLFLTATGIVASLRKRGTARGERDPRGVKGRSMAGISGELASLRLTLLRANSKPQISGAEELPGAANYFIGSDPKKWHVGIPTYAKVKYAGVYPGVDLVYYGKQGQLECDFVLAAGADPTVIALTVAGAMDLRVDDRGNLRVKLGDDEITLRAPQIYQEINGIRHPVAGRYRLKNAHTVEFALARYRRDRPLVIDPVLAYSTFLANAGGMGIAVDSAGEAYVTGYTLSTNFPTTAGAFQIASGGDTDAFVTKLGSSGAAPIYSTYLGGSSTDVGEGIAVDAAGDAYVTGYTLSTNFPTTAGAFRTTSGGDADAFVAKLTSSGGALVFSTYLGGSGDDNGAGIAADSEGNSYITGDTNSPNFPVTAGAFQTVFGGVRDAFVTKLSPGGGALAYSTYLGGSGNDFANGIAVDAAGNAYLTGGAGSPNFPTTPGAFQTSIGGSGRYNYDAFVTKLDSSGRTLRYSTFLGGSSADYGYGIVVDSTGAAFVTGDTNSRNFPTTASAFQSSFGNISNGYVTNAFVTKLRSSGTALAYSTYLGGSGFDFGKGIALGPAGNAYVTGATDSTDFPTTAGALQTAFGGETDAFLTKLNNNGATLSYSTYLGGSSDDSGKGLAATPGGDAYLTGYTTSTNFPTTAGAFQTTFGGEGYAFVLRVVFAFAGTPGTVTCYLDSVSALLREYHDLSQAAASRNTDARELTDAILTFCQG